MLAPLTAALAERGYDTLTPVQEAVTAPALEGADLLVSAQTGSGKTVGFGLAIAHTLLGDDEKFGPPAAPLALIVAPTRELAFQVMEELRWLYSRTNAVVTSCVGGMDMRQERRTLDRGTHIVVGTPGRLTDHLRRGGLDLSDVRAVVLDEADEMLDLGFREDLEFILGAANENRRTLMFSATVSPMIAKLASKFQRDAQRVTTISKGGQHADIEYKVLRVAPSDRDNAIFNLLRFHEEESALVFANTRAAVAHLSARLGNRGLRSVTLSGELSQSERTHALQAMRDGRAQVCVATDVAARGIDLPNLNLVIHADLPSNTESLLHRSGRTGRAGRKGISALIVPHKMSNRAERLLKSAKITAEWTVPPSAEEILHQDEERLLSDPALSDPITPEQAEFTARLLAEHSPEAVAAAFLRLHQSRHAAPEELMAPETKPASDHAAFGPSRWFALSIGRSERAEPRWILPMVLRSTDLNKSAIGAIRVQEDETFIEIAEAGVAQFQAALGQDGELSDGVKARLLDGRPDLGQGGRKPRPEGRKPSRDHDDSAGASSGRPHDGKPHHDKPKRSGNAGGETGGWQPEARSSSGGGAGDQPHRGKPHAPKPAWKHKAKGAPIKPGGKAPHRGKPGGGKPKTD